MHVTHVWAPAFMKPVRLCGNQGGTTGNCSSLFGMGFFCAQTRAEETCRRGGARAARSFTVSGKSVNDRNNFVNEQERKRSDEGEIAEHQRGSVEGNQCCRHAGKIEWCACKVLRQEGRTYRRIKGNEECCARRAPQGWAAGQRDAGGNREHFRREQGEDGAGNPWREDEAGSDWRYAPLQEKYGGTPAS